ncbi:uridine diphosphate glucose pyrophosphatase isoform X4 [Heterocephalus glaber]|uniref:Uridine diphosphate glucose pyrophosphatase NUDT14 n=2 Tax=Heterocephalus glaber TaxID=10181 RepID=A0AAX6QLN3_HETGA|nr:uridine diphosphate glucose pyrophosphatase isoform X4 [Heterocephalus glaber]
MNETLTTAFRSASSGALLQSRKVTPGHRQSSSCGGREGGRLLPRGLVGSSPPGGPRAAGRYQLTGTDACTALRSPPPWPVGSPRRGFASPTGPGRLTWAQLPGAPPALRPLSITHAQTAVTHAQPAAAGPPHATMECLEGSAVGPCAGSVYLRPLRLHYRQNGTQKSWDFMKTHDSVAILLFNSSQRSLVLVRQFWPAVYSSEVERCFPGSLVAVAQDGPLELLPALPGSAGVTVELCAGLVDQPGLSLEQVACKEAWEECGYCLAPSDLRRVATYRSGVGLTGSSQTMFYAEVTDAQRGGPGGGLAEEGELIEVVHLPLDGAQAFADDPDIPKTLGVIFGISWFLSQVAPSLSL